MRDLSKNSDHHFATAPRLFNPIESVTFAELAKPLGCLPSILIRSTRIPAVENARNAAIDGATPASGIVRRVQMSSIGPSLISGRPAALTVSRFDPAYIAVLCGIGLTLIFELTATLIATSGHLTYVIEAPYVHLALANQIAHGHYGLVPGESAAPSSTILYPFLLAGLAPLHLGAGLSLAINDLATLLAGTFALLLADECGVPLRRISAGQLFLLSIAVTLALNLAGLAFTGLEHSLHVASSVAYLLGLARFIRRGRCDWW
jgi:hypothetical protein